MNLIDTLLPATPPEPRGARIHWMDERKGPPILPVRVVPQLRRAHPAGMSDKKIKTRERQQLMLSYMRAVKSPLTAKDLHVTFGGHVSTINNYLLKLRLLGLIERGARIDKTYFYSPTKSTEDVI